MATTRQNRFSEDQRPHRIERVELLRTKEMTVRRTVRVRFPKNAQPSRRGVGIP